MSPMSSQIMPSETEARVQPRRGSAGAGGRRPAADGYPAARAHPRRHRARPGRRRRVRPGRAHPADLDPVPPRRRQAGAAGARNHPRRHVDHARPCASSAPSAISRTSPTSPRTRTTSARCGRDARPAAPRPGTLAHDAVARARRPASARPICARFFADALVSPVLTAHPTEVRRKSTIDREMEIAALLDRRERVQLTPEELAANDEQLRRAVLTLWQTNLLRRTKLTVLDEVANGLSFYDYTFLHEVPRLHCALEDRLNQDDGAAARRAGVVPEHGKLDRRRPRRQSVRHRRRDARHAAPAVEPRPALLSRGAARARRRAVARRRILPTSRDDLRALAERSPDTSPHRSGEPYRLRGVRHLCAARPRPRCELDVETTPRAPVGEAAPYASAKEFKADLDVLDRSLIANNSGVIARGRLRLLRRAVDCFGFHLARLDMRQNSAVHERTVAELLDAAMPGMSYLALDEEARDRAAGRASCATRGRWPRHSSNTARRRVGELAVFRAAAEAHRQVRRRRRSPNASSPCARACPTCWRSRVLLKEVGLVDPLRPQRDQHRAAVRDHRGSAGVARRSWTGCCRAARLSPAGRQPRRRAGGDARLFRQQQGRRLRHLGLGALQGRDRRWSRCSSATACGCACSTAAAARSAAAAARATTPSSRSPAAR